MKKQLLLLALILLPLYALADAVEIDGIYYGLDNKYKLATVNSNPNKYSGNISIPESIKYNNVDYSIIGIEHSAFKNCSSLVSISLPNSLRYIRDNAFEKCYSLTTIEIPDDVSEIGQIVFANCTNLKSITMPRNLEKVGQLAFSGCTNLNAVHIKDLNKWCEIGFYNVSSNPLSYAHHLFLNGEEVSDLVISSSVKIISRYTFYNCYSLKHVSIPNSVSKIDDYAFQGCINLETVLLMEGLNSIGKNAFYECNISSLEIPNSVTAIGEEAFCFCRSLETIKLPINLQTISVNCFYGCNKLKKISLPAKVNLISSGAFKNCYFEEIIVQSSTPPTAFGDSFIRYDATLYVPESSIEQYKETEPWKNFKEIKPIKEDPSGIILPHYRASSEGETKIYNTNGKLMKADPTKLHTLPKGVYIVNGKKIANTK